MTKTYFRFDLPKEKGYSPDWCGSGYMGNIRNHKVLFYDEQEGYGVASCDTAKTELDPAFTALSKTEADKLISGVKGKKGQAGVFVEEALKDKWLPETVGIEDVPPVDVETGDEPEKPAEKRVVESKTKFCPICHKMLGFELFYSDNSYSMKIGTSTIQGIPAGQTINVPCTGHTAKITVSGARIAKLVKPEEIEPEAPVTRFCPICHELLILKGREKIESEVEELIPENVTENYSNESYRVLTCPNGHRVKEVNNG